MMRMGFLGLAGIVLLVGIPWLTTFSQQLPTPQVAGSSQQQVLSVLLPSGVQQIVVVDQAAQTMATYHIEPTAGKIRLMSVRNIRLDMQLVEFNASSPLPSEMRQMKPQ
ncbi:MAG: hypothetical protein U0892_10450 [Pirellulales bacterium]